MSNKCYYLDSRKIGIHEKPLIVLMIILFAESFGIPSRQYDPFPDVTIDSDVYDAMPYYVKNYFTEETK